MGSPCVPEMSTVTFDALGLHHILRADEHAVGNIEQAVIDGRFP